MTASDHEQDNFLVFANANVNLNGNDDSSTRKPTSKPRSTQPTTRVVHYPSLCWYIIPAIREVKFHQCSTMSISDLSPPHFSPVKRVLWVPKPTAYDHHVLLRQTHSTLFHRQCWTRHWSIQHGLRPQPHLSHL